MCFYPDKRGFAFYKAPVKGYVKFTPFSIGPITILAVITFPSFVVTRNMSSVKLPRPQRPV